VIGSRVHQALIGLKRGGRWCRAVLTAPFGRSWPCLLSRASWDRDRDVLDDHGRHISPPAIGRSAKIRIDTLEPIETTLGRRQLRLVLARAELHQEELLENWRLARPVRHFRDRPAPMIGLTPDIVSVVVVRHGLLRLTFTDGLIGEVEVLDRMRGPVFEQARTPEGSRR